MARGPSRAPSQHAYRGTVGTTRTQIVQVTAPSGDIVAAQVHVAVDAIADPELALRLQSDDPERALNAIAFADGSRSVVSVPVVYHDPAAEVFVLVLGDRDRHRELDERARLYAELAAERLAVPAYVRDFAVVFGSRGLRAYLEGKAEAALERQRTSDGAAAIEKARADLERDRAALERDKAQLDRRRAELAAREADLDRARVEIERINREHERRRAELDVANAELAQKLAEAQRPARAPTPAPVPVSRPSSQEEITTNPFEMAVEIASPEPALPAGADPVTTETRDVALGADAWLEAFAGGAAGAAIAVDDQGVRLALRVGGPSAALAHGALDVRLQLHRLPSYPLVSITVGTPVALRGAGHAYATALLDVAGDVDRRALAALEKQFALTIELVDGARPVRRAKLVAPLAANAGYVVRAAQDHLRTLAQEHVEISAARARKAALAPDYDLLGLGHDEAAEWRSDKLVQLDTAAHVRRAIAMARRFARPAREDYLVCVRGYPLERWHAERRAVLARAVELGLWMGPELAQVAVSEGLARSRKDLVQRLDQAFEAVVVDVALNDLDADAADDNRKAIAEEARALGVSLPRDSNGKRAIASGDEPVASGTIEGGRGRATTPIPSTLKGRTLDELIALLDDRGQRVAAALELCDRADGRAARAVIASVRRLSRAEAVRVLGASVKFGEAAAPALTAGLASSKAFLRHGCALALALLRTETGTESVIDLLLSEPTEIWREIARAVGQVGPGALMPLASRLGRLGDRATPSAKERIGWAMAHIGVRGGKQAVETLANGHSAVAPVARTALELMAPAAKDDLRVRGGATGGSSPGRDVTVNRAFSRRFFEALERGLPELAAEGLEALDASGPMEMLDESDLLEDLDVEDGEAELDESDLIPT